MLKRVGKVTSDLQALVRKRCENPHPGRRMLGSRYNERHTCRRHWGGEELQTTSTSQYMDSMLGWRMGGKASAHGRGTLPPPSISHSQTQQVRGSQRNLEGWKTGKRPKILQLVDLGIPTLWMWILLPLLVGNWSTSMWSWWRGWWWGLVSTKKVLGVNIINLRKQADSLLTEIWNADNEVLDHEEGWSIQAIGSIFGKYSDILEAGWDVCNRHETQDWTKHESAFALRTPLY